MSTYVSARSAMIAQATSQVCTQLQLTQTDLEAVEEARRIVADLRSATDLPRLMAMLPPSAAPSVQRLAPQAWSAADAALRFGSADAALQQMRAAMTRASSVIARTGREVVANAIAEFGSTAGQDFDAVTVATGNHVTVVDLRRGDEVLQVRIDDAGGVDREYKGLAGMSCQDVDAALVCYLHTRGILLETMEEDPHGGRRDGVRLIDPSTCRDRACPARGAVADAERPLASIWLDEAAQAPATRKAGGKR